MAQEEWLGDLNIGLVNRRTGLLPQIALDDVGNHSDDGQPVRRCGMVFHRDPFADWILTGPKPSSHGPANDHDAWDSGSVLRAEIPASKQPNPHHAKIIRA